MNLLKNEQKAVSGGRPSMTQVVYEHLKESILYRRIAPGTQLVEELIGEKMTVSRTPIRKAIQKLEDEGLVNILANRGAFVVQPTISEIEQAFEMRRNLEKMTIHHVWNQMTREDLLHLNELVEHERITYQTKNILDYLEVNKQFHMFLAKKARNTFLIDYTEKILDQINVYLMLYDVFYEENPDGVYRFQEHHLLIEAFEMSDLGRLSKLIDRHSHESLRYLSDMKLSIKH